MPNWWRVGLWWIIFCVNMTSHRVPRSNISGYVCVFLGKIRIWIGRFSKLDCPPQCWWATFKLLKVWIQQKSEKGGIHSFFLSHCLSWNIFFSPVLKLKSHYHPPRCLALGLRLYYPTGFPGPSAHRHRPWDFSVSIKLWADLIFNYLIIKFITIIIITYLFVSEGILTNTPVNITLYSQREFVFVIKSMIL